MCFKITADNRRYIIDWLNDRSTFHQWFSSIITGSFVVVTVFGQKPNFEEVGGVILSAAVFLFLFSIICNLVCVWSIPTWKYKVNTLELESSKKMKFELSVTSWMGVISFVSGLTFGVIGNSFIV